ncbi:MAG: hypothetical protein EBZ69_02520 [Alphaproteobacteria bacterium]|nr:hypothetical protein [Alphaproteobacteria bacterium]
MVRGKVHYQCPESGPQTLPTKEFVECWHDVARDCVYRQFGISVWRE